jgi:hypothetical protein
LYEPDAVLAFPPGSLATGHAEIRKVYEQLVAGALCFRRAGSTRRW